MGHHDRDKLQDIIEELFEHLVAIAERKHVTLPEPIRVTPRRIERN